MPVEVRRYRESDAVALAALFERNSYGPAQSGLTLTGEGLEAVFRERLVTDCFVGADGDTIHGCIALSVGSGRRSTRPDQRFAGLFVIDATHRRSMLAGKLFREVFQAPSDDNGIRALRIEANPANRQAFPLYLRVGFRSRSATRPDYEGYTELVSHLPGVTRDLLSNNVGEQLESVLPRLNWRMMRGGRNSDDAVGTTDANGRAVVDYVIDTGDMEFQVVVDHETGRLVDIRQTRGALITLPSPSPVVDAPRPSTIWRQHLVDDVRLRVCDDGALTLERGGETLLSELWPVTLGDDAPAVRRQGRRRAVTASVEDDGGLRLKGEGDPVERFVHVSADGRHLTITSQTLKPGATVISTPWVSMRSAEHAVLLPTPSGSSWRGGPALQGLWPPVWTDFEAACPASDALATWWFDGTTGIQCGWTGMARHEGLSAPTLWSEEGGGAVQHRFHINPEMPVVDAAIGFRAVLPPLRRRQSRRAPRPAPQIPSAPEFLSSGGIVTVTTASQSLRIAAEAGIIDWRVNNATVLSGSYPSGGVWGSLPRRRTGLWCATLGPRDDVDQGVEWASDAESLPFSTSPTPKSWSIVLSDVNGMEIVVDGADATRENAVHLVPVTNPTPEFVVRVNGHVWRVAPGTAWQGSVTAGAVALRDGRALVVQPMQARRPELYLRSHPAGAQLVALGHGTAPLRVQVVVAPSLGMAEQMLWTGVPSGEHHD